MSIKVSNTLLFLIFGLFTFKDRAAIGQRQHIPVTNIFEENAESRFEILEKVERLGYSYRTVESNFKNVHIQLVKSDIRSYFAHFVTTTKRSTGIDGQERNIKVNIKSFDNPAENIIEIDTDCDDIDLQNHTYRTAKYGCCGTLDHHEVFDYANKKIIEGDGKIATGFIPNSRLIIYAGFVREAKDSTIFGKLYYSTSDSERFTIKIKGEPADIRACGEILPDISFTPSDKRNTFDHGQNDYTLWSFDTAEKQEMITNLSIKLKIGCVNRKKSKVLKVPIINGKPFGNSLQGQETTLK